MSRYMLLRGDARRIPLADQSVNCVVTSPPYFGLRDYGTAGQIGLEPTPEAFVAAMVGVFREVRRVLRDDGTCWLNLGSSYVSSPPGNSDTFSSGLNGAQTSKKYAKRLLTKDNRSLRPRPSGLKPKDLIGIPWMVAFALQADGWYLRSDIIWAKPNPMPESVTDRPTKAHEYLFLLTKRDRYYYDAAAIKEPAAYAGCDRGGSTNRYEQNDAGMDNKQYDDRNKRSVWTVATEPFKGSHFATMPPKLVEPCVLAGSRRGDVVFDPFGGAMTTAVVALANGRRAVATELNPKYLAIGKRRLDRPHARPLKVDDPAAVVPLPGQQSLFA